MRVLFTKAEKRGGGTDLRFGRGTGEGNACFWICEHCDTGRMYKGNVNRLLNTGAGARKTLYGHSGAQTLSIKRRRLNYIGWVCKNLRQIGWSLEIIWGFLNNILSAQIPRFWNNSASLFKKKKKQQKQQVTLIHLLKHKHLLSIYLGHCLPGFPEV